MRCMGREISPNALLILVILKSRPNHMVRCDVLLILTATLLLPQVQASSLPGIVFTRTDLFRGAILFGSGDAAAQLLTHHEAGGALHETSFDNPRLVKATALGTVYGGFLLPFVYQLAESLFPGRTPRNVVLKTVVSCSLLSTGGNYFSLFMRNLLKPTHVIDEHFGDRILRCIDSVNQVFHNLLLDDLRVWPLYDVLCFAIVPPAIRPAATSAVSVCWHTYVAYVANRKAGCVAAVA